MWFEEKRIILASASPRRRELLEAAGISLEVRVAPVEEYFPENLPASDLAAYLAREKGRAARSYLTPSAPVLLAADSVVIVGEEPLAKPENPEDARRMLRMLSGQWHEVTTGVCLLSEDREEVFSDTTRVRMETLSETEMDYYISTYHPFDKAGAYAIQEWIGLCRISAIEGSYANVVGLPVHRVYERLAAFFDSR